MLRALAVVALATAIVTPALAQDAEVLYFADFEDGTVDFLNPDPVAELGITTDEDLVFAGEGSLQLEYVQSPMYLDVPEWGFPGAVILEFPDGGAGLGEVAFALRSRLATPVLVMVAEGDDGPRYRSLLWSSADEWSEFSLTLDDFTFDPDGPPDPNGKLDPELLAGVAIIDADGFIRTIAEPSPLFSVEPVAEQALWLDEFTLRSAPAQPAPEPQGAPALADYSPPMGGFLLLGGRDVNVTAEEQQDGEFALRLDYTTPAGTLFGVMHMIPQGAMTHGGAVRMQARTNRDLTLVVALEERREPGEIGKSRYETVVELTASEQFETVTLPLSLFELGDDQTDPDGELNPELVETLSIVDGTAAFENTEVINTLRLKAPVLTQ
jgi:hypothetical protein